MAELEPRLYKVGTYKAMTLDDLRNTDEDAWLNQLTKLADKDNRMPTENELRAALRNAIVEIKQCWSNIEDLQEK